MTCPHCTSPLSSISIDTVDGQSQAIDECLNCGGHFLQPYVANFLSIETAKNIDSVLPKLKAVPATHPTCPKCGQIMPSIKDDSVPGNVTIFTCPNNHGDFFPKGQLLAFKKAQQAKLYYHKLWGIPLKSAFAIIIPLLVIFTAITAIPTVIKQLGTSQESRVKADNILTAPQIIPLSSTEVLISFSTKNPAIATIRFTEGLTDSFTVSQTAQTSHLININSLTSGTLYKYVISLNIKGKVTTTEEYTFATP